MATIERHCPECGPGATLVVRVNRTTGEEFLGCPRWPNCTYTERIPESVRMRLRGVATLPGME